MAVTAHVFPQFIQALATKKINLSSDALKWMLLEDYTFSDAHATMADVKGAGTEASGTGYTANGQAASGVTIDTSGTTTTLDADDPEWEESDIDAAFSVLYYAGGGTDATNIPIAYVDFGGNKTSEDGTFKLVLNASGIWSHTAG